MDDDRRAEIVRRLSEIPGAEGPSEMEGLKAASDQEQESSKNLPFSRMDVMGIDIDSNPSLEIICNFGKSGDKPVHILIAIAFAYANGNLAEEEASNLHFSVLHSISAQIEDNPNRNLIEARLFRVEALAKAIKSMKRKPRHGEASNLEEYQIGAILGSAASLKAADALDPSPTQVSDTRGRTRRLILASGIAGLAMGVGAALGAAYPEKVHKAESSIGSAVKATADWVSKKWEEIK